MLSLNDMTITQHQSDAQRAAVEIWRALSDNDRARVRSYLEPMCANNPPAVIDPYRFARALLDAFGGVK